MSVVILIPHDLPVSGDYIYSGLLSAFDDNLQYDQIGMISNYNSGTNGYYPTGMSDTWQVAWAGLPNCGLPSSGDILGTNWNVDVYTLNPGIYYNFSMAIASGTVTYTVSELLGGPSSFQYPVWSHAFWTGGNNLREEAQVACGPFGQTVSGYTNYEESDYSVQQNVPNWGIYFYLNTAGGSLVTSWANFAAGTLPCCPSPLYQTITGSNNSVANEYFTLNLSTYQTSAYAGSILAISGWSDNVYPAFCPLNCGTESISKTYIHPSGTGWAVTFSPPSGAPAFTFTVHVTIPASAPPQWYTIGIKSYDSYLSAFTTLQLTVDVLRGGGGGGGCVATGVNVLTSTGYVKDQNLVPSVSRIKVFNLTTGASDLRTLGWLNSTVSHALVSINNGRLIVTALDQPLYVKNLTATAWLRDPQNLSLGELLFDPVNHTWISVTNLSAIITGTTVYDVAPLSPAPADFDAAGFIAYKKLCAECTV